MADIATIIGGLISIGTLITGFTLYCIEKRKTHLKHLAQLKREIDSNLKALEFSCYEKFSPLNYDSPIFIKLVNGLKNEMTAFCLYNDFVFPQPKNNKFDKKKYKDNGKRILSFIINSVDQLRQLSTYEQEDGPPIILMQRFNNLKDRLIELKSILEARPTMDEE